MCQIGSYPIPCFILILCIIGFIASLAGILFIIYVIFLVAGIKEGYRQFWGFWCDVSWL
jgi:hypothetical protein